MSEGYGSESPKSMTDDIFARVQNYITNSIQRFVAFLFVLISIGAVAGYVVASRGEPGIIVLLPALAGIFAYYSRGFAIAVFALFIILLVLL